MRMYDLIMKKRNGDSLTREEIAFFIDGYVRGTIPDYQASALCMAIWFRGMTDDEIVALTDCMAHSGDTVDLSRFGSLSVDKHSTGGVGDKTSLIITPIVASLGAKIAKMSGRGLGHTGGTVDKLESIPGMKVAMDEEAFLKQAEEIGIALIGQTGNLTPADKKLYALRDVTATVDSIPLITSSIMSKKLAAGSKNIVLDVKVGSGAFMKTYDDAKKLAQEMVSIGKSCGRNMAALLTDMDCPLGHAVGNSLEVQEAISVLKGDVKGDLYEVCIALATEMVVLLKGCTPAVAKEQVVEAVESGRALRKMREWIATQGGDPEYIDHPERFPKAAHIVPIISDRDGYISRMNAEDIGSAAAILGAGRLKKEDAIDFSAGIILNKKTGDRVCGGDILAYLHTNDGNSLKAAEERYRSALEFSAEPPADRTLVYEIIR